MSKFSRSRTRKFLYQNLYAQAFNLVEEVTFRESFFDGVFSSQIDEEYFSEMKKNISEKEAFYIWVIQRFFPKFNIVAMDLAFLLPSFIALAEIFSLTEELPLKVIINEAVEISKSYWTPISRKMVNGLLDSVNKNLDELQEEYKNFDFSKEFISIFKK